MAYSSWLARDALATCCQGISLLKCKDVGVNDWFTGYIGAAHKAGLLEGFPTREAMSFMYYNATENANLGRPRPGCHVWFKNGCGLVGIPISTHI